MSGSTDQRKLIESEADEVFVLKKKQETTVTKTVCFSILDLVEKINDEDNKKKPIDTPKFKMGNLKLHFIVYPEDNEGHIGFYIENPNKEDVLISLELKESPQKSAFSNRRMKANTGHGWKSFVSHDAYRKWAAENGDVFKITATVTRHLKSAEKWTTLR